jgi:hypothetical protein
MTQITPVSGSSFLPTDTTGTENQINVNSAYLVDFTKVETPNDLILILSGLGMAFPGNHPLINQLKPFLNLESPLPLQGLQESTKSQRPTEEKVELKLPKVDKI